MVRPFWNSFATDSDSIVGCLVRNSDFPVLPDQRDAWLEQISLLQAQLGGLTGLVFMEFSIPHGATD